MLERVKSFNIDHNELLPGLYVHSVDKVGNEMITTYDIRMKRPNVELPIRTDAVHTLEHLGAHYLRTQTDVPVIYFGPMGCRTGFYLILAGKPDLMGTQNLLKRMFGFIAKAKEIPGANEKECGNAADHNLIRAQAEAITYSSRALGEV